LRVGEVKGVTTEHSNEDPGRKLCMGKTSVDFPPEFKENKEKMEALWNYPTASDGLSPFLSRIKSKMDAPVQAMGSERKKRIDR
jgi:hypothetical protein